MDISNLRQLSRKAEPSTKKLFAVLKKKKPDQLDTIFQELHDRAFERIDCLACANCCKTTSPIFKDKDIERLAKHFRVRPADFTEKYLHLDEDHDYVLNSAPCPFLGADNYCSVYESRPNACREYPHTDRKKMHQILDLTIRNTAVCPAVYEIVEGIKKRLA